MPGAAGAKRSPSFEWKMFLFLAIATSYSSTLFQVDINEKLVYWELMTVDPLHNYNDLKCFQNAKWADKKWVPLKWKCIRIQMSCLKIFAEVIFKMDLELKSTQWRLQGQRHFKFIFQIKKYLQYSFTSSVEETVLQWIYNFTSNWIVGSFLASTIGITAPSHITATGLYLNLVSWTPAWAQMRKCACSLDSYMDPDLWHL